MVDILGSIDEKIENLELQIKKLFELYSLQYKKIIYGKHKIAKLSDIAIIESGKRPMNKIKERSHLITVPIIGASSIMGYTSNFLYNEPLIVIGRVGTLGTVQPIFYKCWASDNTLVIKTKYYTFVYNVLYNFDYTSINKGSTQPLITQTDIKSIQIILPPKEELNCFESSFSMQNIEIYRKQIEELNYLKQLYLKKFFS